MLSLQWRPVCRRPLLQLTGLTVEVRRRRPEQRQKESGPPQRRAQRPPPLLVLSPFSSPLAPVLFLRGRALASRASA
jgi:hypothetical protein